MYIGIDIGGTTGRVAAFDSLEQPVVTASEHFPMSREYAQDFPRLLGAVQNVRGEAEVQGIGVGLAGVVNDDETAIVASGNLAGWHGSPIRADLAAEFDCPLRLANDAYVAALSEASAHQEDFWFVIWGTGIGGSYVEYRDGKPAVIPSEFSHQTIDPDSTEPPDGCGRPGCLEGLVGGANIERRFGYTAGALTDEEWENVSGIMADGLYNMLMVRPATEIVFGGGVASKHADRLPRVAELLAGRMKHFPTPEIGLATYGEKAGVTGAVMLLRA